MNYPLNFSFKIIALASQIYAQDANGKELFYVKQKLFKLKENIEVYSDSTKQNREYLIKADRVIDFSPVFTLYDNNDQVLGSVKRNGKQSIWRANYEVNVGPNLKLKVQENNPWVKVADSIIESIPVISFFAGYFFHPKYDVFDANNQIVASLTKIPAFFEGKYTIQNNKLTEYDEYSQKIIALLMMVVITRERMRG